jgi:hypothetical protein
LLFIESKAKRLQLAAKTEIRSEDALSTELDKLASFVVQLYKRSQIIGEPLPACFLPARQASRPARAHPFGPRTHEILNSHILRRLRRGNGLEMRRTDALYDCVNGGIERLVQVLVQSGIAPPMEQKTRNPEYRHWLVDPFLRHAYPGEYRTTRDLFPETLNEIITHVT